MNTIMGSPMKDHRRQTDVHRLMLADHKVELINDCMHELHVLFHGPENSHYHGYVWKMRVELPDGYPIDSSPSIGFVNKIYHPNVDEKSGSICLDVINQKWTPIYELKNVFELLLPQLLLYPNPYHPLNREAAALMIHDQTSYEQKVKEYCERFAKPEDVWPDPEEKSSDEESTETEDSSSDEAIVGKADP